MKTSLRLPLCIALFVLGCNDSKHVRSRNDALMSSMEAESSETSDGAPGSREPSSALTNDAGNDSNDSSDDSNSDGELARYVSERSRKPAMLRPNVIDDTSAHDGEIEVHFDGQTGKRFGVNFSATLSAGSAVAQTCLKSALLGWVVHPYERRTKVTYVTNDPSTPTPDECSNEPKSSMKS